MQPVHDVARIHLENALLLFGEFVHAQIKHADLRKFSREAPGLDATRASSHNRTQE
jgi:hypothetical protein